MRCTNCGTELLAGKQFCHSCGQRVTQACPSCGATLAPGFRFCPDCGMQVTATTTAAPAAPGNGSAAGAAAQLPEEAAQKIHASKETIEGERKQVTVLFCDLAGSTAIAARLDPEEYHDLLERYVKLAIEEIYRLEGIVNQLAGDGLMALFGAPIAHEDAPQRAVRAALGIHAALHRLNERLRGERGRTHAIELQARIGINTGPVVVGTVGNDLKMDYTAIGDTTNLASRLESLAQPGTVLISDATSRLLRDAFTLRAVGPFTVKGKREPVAAYEVLGVAAATTPLALAPGRHLTPLVGRSAELAQLIACAQQLKANFTQAVAVIGEAGSGKSRLIYEFKARLAGESAVFFEARCSAWNQMIPYGPWIAMLKQYFDLAADEPSESAAAKLARKLRDFDPSLDVMYPYIARFLSLPVAGEDLPADDLTRQTFEAIGALIIAESERTPVIMVMEDLQWIDQPSREMLDVAVNEMGRKRILLLVSHRPDFQLAWRTHAAYTQLHLRRLTPANITDVVRSVAGGPLPPELEQLILTKAEGNPFLAEEVTRSLLEEGNLAQDGGTHMLTRPVDEIRIPGTVQEVIAARLDRLGAEAKRVLQVAAVLGRQFSRDQLAQLLADDGIDVARELEELERRGVIHRKNLFSNDEYRFGESVTQEVAYEGLLLKQRRQLHERIGLMLEAGGGEASTERLALLAHHFARSDNREKTMTALLQAARAAEQVPAFSSAARFYREAWSAAAPTLGTGAGGQVPSMAVEAAVGLARMSVIYNVPDAGDVECIIACARTLAESDGDTATLASLRTYHGMLLLSSGRERFAEGLALVEEGLAVAQQAGQIQTALGVSRGLAWSYFVDGRFALAGRTIDWVIGELERLGDAARLGDIYLSARWMRERFHFFSDDVRGAEEAARETYELALQANNRTMQSASAAGLAIIHFQRAEYAEAKLWAERSLEVARAIGNATGAATSAALVLAATVELGELPNAGRYLELIDQGLTPGSDLTMNIHFFVHTLLITGEVRRAERAAELAHARAGGRLREMHSALAMAEVCAQAGPARWTEAERWYDQAIALAETLGVNSVLAIARLGAGALAATRGATAASVRHLQQALTLSRDLGLRHFEPRIEGLLAEVQAPAASAPRAGSAVQGTSV
jgi:class 3 adenylate cyclase/tetratricopeptide (TPR) repeat protein